MEIRDRLMQAALRVFEEAGSRGATTRRIATAAGVNEVTLFRHFGSKAALLHEALHTAARENLSTRLPEEPANPRQELTHWCRMHLAHLRRSRSMIRTCMGEFEQSPEIATCAGSTPARVAGELQGYLSRLRERGMADPELDVSAAAAVLMGALFTDAMLRDLMADRYDYSPEEAPERYVALFLRTIGAHGSPDPSRSPAGRVASPTDGQPTPVPST